MRTRACQTVGLLNRRGAVTCPSATSRYAANPEKQCDWPEAWKSPGMRKVRTFLARTRLNCSGSEKSWSVVCGGGQQQNFLSQRNVLVRIRILHHDASLTPSPTWKIRDEPGSQFTSNELNLTTGKAVLLPSGPAYGGERSAFAAKLDWALNTWASFDTMVAWYVMVSLFKKCKLHATCKTQKVIVKELVPLELMHLSFPSSAWVTTCLIRIFDFVCAWNLDENNRCFTKSL